MSVECIITGCNLYDPAYFRWVHGDLHQTQDIYVFNACLDEKGESRWISGTAPEDERMLVCMEDYNIWVRRGVFVIPKMYAYLNDLAAKYLKEVPF